MHLMRQICKEMVLEGSLLQMMATYIIKGITNVFDIKHSCAYYSNYVSLIQGHVTLLYPRLETVKKWYLNY